MFALSFKNGNDVSTRDSFHEYHVLLVEIKDLNALISNKPFFDQPGKNKQETYEKPIEMSKNDGYTTGNLLNYLYYQKYYKLIGIDLSRQTNTSILQQIKLEENDFSTMFSCFWKAGKNNSKLFFRFINCNRII